MKKTVIYIHGSGGNAQEAAHYTSLFRDCNVIGLDYAAQFPWEAKKEFPLLFQAACKDCKSVQLIANSIGAYFALNALSHQNIEKAYFISPVVDMERLILDMMAEAKVTEAELREKKEIPIPFGQTLSWKYLCYARENPVTWTIPTHILYGQKDSCTSYPTIFEFAKQIGAELTVMENGPHWFHTPDEMKFLDDWIGQASGILERENPRVR